MRSNSRGKRWMGCGAIALVIAAFYFFFPPFYVQKIRTVGRGGNTTEAEGTGTFSPQEFVAKFWTEKLLPAAHQAQDAATVLAAMRSNLKEARTKFGRTTGIGGPTYFFITGTARITKKTGSEMTLTLAPTGESPDILIPFGILFGNALRDGSGLLDVNNFASSPQFNAISTELNHRVETGLLPQFMARGDVGVQVNFGGICEVAEDDTTVTTLTLIPVFADVRHQR